MPKNEKEEVKCINHIEQQMVLIPYFGILHGESKITSENASQGINLKFDVYICPICDYTE